MFSRFMVATVVLATVVVVGLLHYLFTEIFSGGGRVRVLSALAPTGRKVHPLEGLV